MIYTGTLNHNSNQEPKYGPAGVSTEKKKAKLWLM